MIKVEKSRPPEIIYKLQGNQKYSRKAQFRFSPEIKNAVREEFHNKCAYCETKVGIASFGDIEHFKPKSVYPNSMYDWDNILLSCSVCNMRKANRFPVDNDENPLLISPVKDQPEEYFTFTQEGLILPKSNLPEHMKRQAETSIHLIGLNRDALVQNRKKTLDNIRSNFNFLQLSSKDEIEKIRNYVHQLLNELSDNRSEEYYAFRKYIYERIEKDDLDFLFETNNDDLLGFQNRLLEFDLDKGGKEDIKKYRNKKILISEIKIQNFKNISNIHIKLKNPEEAEKAPSIIILGENGSGKTSILQAITLTLLGGSAEKITSKLGLKPKSFLQKNQFDYKDHCRVEIKLTTDNDELEILKLDKDNFTWENKGRKLPILAYGSTRLLSKSNIPKTKYKGLRISNLFNPVSRLVNAEIWLKRLYKINIKAFTIVTDEILRNFLLLEEDQKIEKINNQIVINSTHISQWSEGNKSVTAIVCDILMAMSELWDDREIENITDYTGIVLIDELELHLHPSWKIKIFQLLRDTFPAIQFIITTHDPLCLRGAESGEVHIIKENNGEIDIVQKDIPKGNFIDQLLTGDWFMLNTTLDRQTLNLMENHRQLAIKYNLSKKEKIDLANYENALREVLGVFADNTYFGIYKRTLQELKISKAADKLTKEETKIVQDKFKTLLDDNTRI